MTGQGPTAAETFFSGWLASEDAQRDIIAVKKMYVDINDGNLHDGMLFSQIMFWHGNSKETGKPRMSVKKSGHLWLAKQYKEWWDECRIKKGTAKQCIDRMVKRGLLIREQHRFGGMRTVHLRVNPERFYELVTSRSVSRDMTDRRDATRPTGETPHDRPSSETSSETTAETTNFVGRASDAVGSDPVSPETDPQQPIPGTGTPVTSSESWTSTDDIDDFREIMRDTFGLNDRDADLANRHVLIRAYVAFLIELVKDEPALDRELADFSSFCQREVGAWPPGSASELAACVEQFRGAKQAAQFPARAPSPNGDRKEPVPG
jgi:hypothetical protein